MVRLYALLAATVGVVLCAGVAPATRPVEQGNELVVVELFTSEGCSSCPPADELLSTLAARSGVAGVEVLALGQHVDYWDRLGWRDPFSTAGATARQYAYGASFGLRSVYTPQAVVDGCAEMLGSDPAALRAAIAAGGKAAKGRVGVTVVRKEGNRAEVRVRLGGVVVAEGGAELMLGVTEGGLSTEVKRGENAGRKLRHAPVVRSLEAVRELAAGKLGGSAGEEELVFEVKVDPKWKPEELRAVVFVQSKASRRISAVGAAGFVGG